MDCGFILKHTHRAFIILILHTHQNIPMCPVILTRKKSRWMWIQTGWMDQMESTGGTNTNSAETGWPRSFSLLILLTSNTPKLWTPQRQHCQLWFHIFNTTFSSFCHLCGTAAWWKHMLVDPPSRCPTPGSNMPLQLRFQPLPPSPGLTAQTLWSQNFIAFSVFKCHKSSLSEVSMSILQ